MVSGIIYELQFSRFHTYYIFYVKRPKAFITNYKINEFYKLGEINPTLESILLRPPHLNLEYLLHQINQNKVNKFLKGIYRLMLLL